MVREALCFGWIDSLVKRLDDDRYALKVTPRQPTSKWSDINRKRWAELKAAGLLTSAGRLEFRPPFAIDVGPLARGLSRCDLESVSVVIETFDKTVDPSEAQRLTNHVFVGDLL